jgi:hypothetical protein
MDDRSGGEDRSRGGIPRRPTASMVSTKHRTCSSVTWVMLTRIAVHDPCCKRVAYMTRYTVMQTSAP